MNFKDYQDFAKKDWQPGCDLKVFALGLGGESGEVLDIIKKVFRDQKPIEEVKDHLKEELGDVLWYIANLCNVLGFDLENVAIENKLKLNKRYGGKIKND